MPLIHPVQNDKITDINRELSKQRLLYDEAIIRDSELSVKKEIRTKIRKLQAKIYELIRQQKS